MYKDASPKAINLSDYQVPSYSIDRVNLEFDLKEQGTRVRAELVVRKHPDTQSGTDLRLHGEELKAIRVAIDGRELAEDQFEIDEQSITLKQPPEQFVLETEVEIAPENNTALEGLYRSSSMFCTQCEAEGFRKITWFLDRPDVMAIFTTKVIADKSKFPVLLSNGNPGETGELEEGRHFGVWHDPFPKPAYLFALVAGDLQYVQDKHTTPSGKEVDLRIYTEAENIDKCDHAMRALINSMKWDEQVYGREYDLDVYNIVAVNDFNMGAMENKGLNIFNSKYVLARQDTATDQDFQGIEGVIAHEYFHNWTGNRITCRDWFQLSLKEGFTVFRDQEFSADMGSRGVKRIEDVRMLRTHQFAEDASPMAHPIRPASYIEINNFYTLTVYEKGAEVVRMQANLLGPDAFRKATDLYFEGHDGQAVTTEDFVACMSDASGRDLEQFKHWYDYAGTPQLKITDHYDAAAQKYTLSFEQSVPDTPEKHGKPPFHVPVMVGLVAADGTDLLASNLESRNGSYLLELHDHEQSFEFEGIKEHPVPSLLRGFSAPVKVEFDYSSEQLMFLMAQDSDGFNRWDAAQSLSQRVILGMVTQYQAGQEMQVPDGYVEAFRNALMSGAEPALLAEVLSLPGIGYLGDFMSQVDIDALNAARETLRQALANSLQEELLETYYAMKDDGEYQVSSEAIGRRRLKNLCLSYLMAEPNETVVSLCVSQYDAQHNMTDVIAALALLADSDHLERTRVLQDFADRWQDDPLVMDKWFSVQALSTREDALLEVIALMSHPAFSIKNPNKVRSLIGAFANGNPLRFHAADGSGYQFLADQVLALDELNPQVASRMLRVMSRWQRYDEKRQHQMKAALERVVAANVSKDVYEIASKSLSS